MMSSPTKVNLLEAIRQRVLVGDGAMGTQLQQAGLEPGGVLARGDITEPHLDAPPVP